MTKSLSDYQSKWREIYRQALTHKAYDEDTAQLVIVDEFARIAYDLASKQAETPKNEGFFGKLFTKKPAEPTRPKVQSFYCYGTVGRGKTFLMDLFCAHIDVAVTRVHYHHFMKDIHERLKAVNDKESPLEQIARDIASELKVLCLDEFFVSDITNAMLLYGLLRGLLDNGVVIITTSNVKPDDLYKGGLQRARFLPAIDLINRDFNVIHIADGEDHRRATLASQPHFLHPLTTDNKQRLSEMVNELTRGQHLEHDGNVDVNQRDIAFKLRTSSLIWFEFSELCQTARSQLDYIELAKDYQYFIVSNLPELGIYEEDSARRLLLLVDELYDRRRDLLVTSEKPMTEIYSGEKMRFEFERLQSRLHEMQSSEYGS